MVSCGAGQNGKSRFCPACGQLRSKAEWKIKILPCLRSAAEQDRMKIQSASLRAELRSMRGARRPYNEKKCVKMKRPQ